MTTTPFQASNTLTRSGFLGLAAAVSFSLLASMAQIADRQVDGSLMAQATQAKAPDQVVVIVGKRLSPRA